MSSHITLHADLLDTDLQDFDTHWWGVMRLPRNRFLRNPPGQVYAMVRSEDNMSAHSEDTLYFWKNFPSPGIGVFTSDDYDDAVKELKGVQDNFDLPEPREWPDPRTRAHMVMTKRIGFPAAAYYVTAVLATRGRARPPSTPEETHFTHAADNHTVLFIARYRRNRLKLVVAESDPQGFGAKGVKEWIAPRWGRAAKWLATIDAPMPAYAALPTAPPIPGSDGYAWDDLFDWWYRGGKLLGYRTLKSLSSPVSIAYGTIKNHSVSYKAQFGARPMPDSRSKFAGMFPRVTIGHDDE